MSEAASSPEAQFSSVEEEDSPEVVLDEQIKKMRHWIVGLTVFMPAWTLCVFVQVFGSDPQSVRTFAGALIAGGVVVFLIALGLWANALLKHKELLCKRYGRMS